MLYVLLDLPVIASRYHALENKSTYLNLTNIINANASLFDCLLRFYT